MSIRAVGFDLDDTLCVPARDRDVLLAEAASAVDAPTEADWTSRAAYEEAHEANLTSDSRTPVFEAMMEDVDVDIDPSEFAAAYRRQVNDALGPLEGVDSLIRELRERYRVGLLTNGPSRAQRSKLDTLGLTEAFDAAFVSGELAAGKPDRRAFEALMDGLDASPEELVYIGNDVTADIGGATAAGCRAIQVMHENGPDPDPRAVAHIPYERLVIDLPRVLADLG